MGRRAGSPTARSALAGLAALAASLAPAHAGASPEDWKAQGRAALARAKAPPSGVRARNVILFIGDGMDLATVTAARIREGQRRGEPGEENLLSFEKLPYTALLKTYNTNQQVPDSAGTMTAMMSGVKTRAGVLGVDETVRLGDHAGVSGHRLRSLVEDAETRGLSTGVVTTTTLTHATPAACYAHSPHRGWENDQRLPRDAQRDDFPDIARQLVEFPHGDGLEVALGGGRSHFLPRTSPDPEFPERKGARADGRDLTAEWTAREGAAYVWNRAQLAAVDTAETKHLLGLFDTGHMRFEVDRRADKGGEPPLSEMTTRAIELLSRNEKGFLLIVEAGRIDHAHHNGNAFRALSDAIELSNAVRAALEKTDPSETLVIVTADHGHVMTIAGYPTRGNDILGKVLPNDARGEPTDEFAVDSSGLPYTTLGYYNGPGFTRMRTGADASIRGAAGGAADERERPDLSTVDTSDPEFLQETAISLGAETHSGEDVPLYAGGPGSHLFRGVQEQTYVYYVIREALGWKD